MSTMKHLLSLTIAEQIAFIADWAQIHQGLDGDALYELIFTVTHYDTVRVDYLRSVAASFNYSA